jgi:hypothetical protein
MPTAGMRNPATMSAVHTHMDMNMNTDTDMDTDTDTDTDMDTIREIHTSLLTLTAY